MTHRKKANAKVAPQTGPHTGFGPNEWLVEELYQSWLEDPSTVDAAWSEFFRDYAEREPATRSAATTTTPTGETAVTTAAPRKPEPAGKPAADERPAGKQTPGKQAPSKQTAGKQAPGKQAAGEQAEPEPSRAQQPPATRRVESFIREPSVYEAPHPSGPRPARIAAGA